MADKKYVDNVLDEDNTRYYIKDSELTERVDDIEDTLENLPHDGGDSETTNSIINVNGGAPIRLWVGSKEVYDSIEIKEPDVVYLIGTPTGGYVPPEPDPDEPTYYTVTKSVMSHCYFSNNATRVEAGSSFTGIFAVEAGYTMDYVSIRMGNEDITDTVYNSSSSSVDIAEVTGDIVISASANIPLTSIQIIPLYNSDDASNIIQMRAMLLPYDTTQQNVRWSIPDSANDFRLSYNTLSAELRVLSTADNASVTVTCMSTDNPSVQPATKTFNNITYVDPGLNPDVPVNPEDSEIDFTGETDVRDILLAAGWGNGGKITKSQALEMKLDKQQCQALFKNNTSITKFDTWTYFKTSHFNVSGCTNLTSVKIPLLEGAQATSSFTHRFGIKNTSITSLVIPEGYVSIDNVVSETGGSVVFADGSTSGVAIQNITFPSTLTTINSQIRDLSGITELDFSNTSLTTICKQLCTNLTNLEVVKFPDTLVSTGNPQIIRTCSNVNRVEFGENFQWFGTSETSMGLFYDSNSSVQPVTFVFHGTVPPKNFEIGNKNVTSGNYYRQVQQILVPESAVTTYRNDPVFSSYASIINAIPENNG
jgi:hypothetical protein